MRDSISPALPGEPVGPYLRMLDNVIVCAYESDGRFHGILCKEETARTRDTERSQHRAMDGRVIFALPHFSCCTPRRLAVIKAVKPHRVLVEEQWYLVLGNPLKSTIKDLPRIWIGRGAMRQVGLPHYMVNAEPIPDVETLAGLFKPEVGIHVATDLIARTGRDPVFPQLPPLPYQIAGIQHIVEPAECGLGTYPVESWISFEHAGEHNIRNKLRQRAMCGWRGNRK